MSVYLFTLPKAGTYFLAELLSNMGLNNTGYHLFKTFYLDTKSHPLEANAETPGIAQRNRFFVPVVRDLKKDDVAFGHFPLPLNPAVAPPHMKYICAYRHPRKTLVAEFIDFRFRRTDIDWVRPEAEPDDLRAFELYMQRRGTTGHLRDFKNVVLYRRMMTLMLTEPAERKKAFFVNFEAVLADPDLVGEIAAFLGIEMSPEAARAVHQKTLGAQTKTKAVDLKVDRDALWSDRIEDLYVKSDFPRTVSIAEKQGLTL